MLPTPKYKTLLTEEALRNLIATQQVNELSAWTGIPLSTLKNYKYDNAEYPKMPYYIAQALTDLYTVNNVFDKRVNVYVDQVDTQLFLSALLHRHPFYLPSDTASSMDAPYNVLFKQSELNTAQQDFLYNQARLLLAFLATDLTELPRPNVGVPMHRFVISPMHYNALIERLEVQNERARKKDLNFPDLETLLSTCLALNISIIVVNPITTLLSLTDKSRLKTFCAPFSWTDLTINQESVTPDTLRDALPIMNVDNSQDAIYSDLPRDPYIQTLEILDRTEHFYDEFADNPMWLCAVNSIFERHPFYDSAYEFFLKADLDDPKLIDAVREYRQVRVLADSNRMIQSILDVIKAMRKQVDTEPLLSEL